jgi:predicted ribosome quality control (RQC) complex YloA/Tae2 family protein
MIQTYNDIAQEIQNFRRKFGEYAQIQKIFSSSQFLSLQIRLPGKSFYLYFGRGHQFEGFWLGEKQIESALRKRDQFLEYFRRYLSASVLLNLDIDEKDRIIKIDYGRFGQTNRMFLFYKGRELYFANIYFDEKVKRFKTFYFS